jgi:hypothetical protein
MVLAVREDVPGAPHVTYGEPGEMTIAELIDLEAQLARDRDVDAATLEARDRALLRGERLDPRDRRGALRRWMAALREHEPGLLRPGRQVEASLRLVRTVLVVAGLALGWGAAAAVLQYTGSHPVNVWDFLLVFVGVQVLLLLFLVGSFVLPVAEAGVPMVGVLRSLAAVAYPRAVERRVGAARAEEWRQLWHRLRTRRSLYRHVEPWLLLGLTQAFGVAFNVAALVACLRLVTFSDLAFSWSTTLVPLDAETFHRVVKAIAAPWAWAWPEAVPSHELVAATRYSRLDAAYVGSLGRRAAEPGLVGRWWSFLVASLTCYGLLPRLGVLVAARAWSAHLLRRLPLDDVEVSRLVSRLTAPHVETRASGAEPAPPEWPSPVAGGPEPSDAAGRCGVVLWRDVPSGEAVRSAVARHARCEVAAVQPAGGRDYEEGGVDWTTLAAGVDGFLVVAEAWEAPDRGAMRLLRQLRVALGTRRPLRVLLVNHGAAGGGWSPPPRDQVELWRQGLARLEDPYLAVEPLEAST